MWSINRYGKNFADAISLLEWTALPPRLDLSPHQVRISVHACALNFFDLLAMCNQYQVKYPLPMSPGTEISGTILEVGSEASKHFQTGQEVIVAFAGNATRREIVVEQNQVLRKPPHLSHLQASALFVGYATAFHGLIQRGHLRKGETVLITGGAGGMGTIAASLAKEHGAGKVICTVSDVAKKDICFRSGATDVIVLDSDSKKWAAQLKSQIPEGVDVCYEICGGDLFEPCMRVMNSYGRLLVIGFVAGIPKAQMNLPLVKGFSIVGVRSGAELLMRPELMHEMEAAMQKTIVVPELDVFPASEAKAAFTKLANRQAQGKIVLDFSSITSKL